MIGVKIMKDGKTVVLSDGRKGELIVGSNKKDILVLIDEKHYGFEKVQKKPLMPELSAHFWCNEFEIKIKEPEADKLVEEPEAEQEPEKKKKKSKKKKDEGDE